MVHKVAVVTGGASGLGKGIAERLGKDGFKLVISDLNQKFLDDTQKEFINKGYEVIILKGDMKTPKEPLFLIKDS